MSGLPETPPPPLEWHPAYRDRTWLLDWLEGRGDYRHHVIEFPVSRRPAVFAETTEVVVPTLPTLTMTRHKCAGGAPYVGRPFKYLWWVGVDNLGRCIASDSTRWYDPSPPACWEPGFDDYADLPDYEALR